MRLLCSFVDDLDLAGTYDSCRDIGRCNVNHGPFCMGYDKGFEKLYVKVK